MRVSVGESGHEVYSMVLAMFDSAGNHSISAEFSMIIACAESIPSGEADFDLKPDSGENNLLCSGPRHARIPGSVSARIARAPFWRRKHEFS